MTTKREPHPLPSAAAAAWGLPAEYTALWPARLAVVAAVALYVILPDRFTLGAALKWGVALLETSLLIPLAVTGSRIDTRAGGWRRPLTIILIAIVNLANTLSLIMLVDALLHGRNQLGSLHLDGRVLVLAAIEIWLTNVLIFSLWYWELDRGGPVWRCRLDHPRPDFLFPQMTTPACAPTPWAPGFVDYLYLSFTNATAFSPTDTLPLTSWAKILMLIQSLISLLTIALVAARAVNILV